MICFVKILIQKPVLGHEKILFLKSYCSSFIKCLFLSLKRIVYKKPERFINICLNSPPVTSGWAELSCPILLLSWNNRSLCAERANCSTDSEQTSRSTVTKTVKCHRSEIADFVSFRGTMRWTDRLEGRWKKKKSFGRDSLKSLNPFYTGIHFSSKATTTGNKHSKKHAEISFTNYTRIPTSPSPIVLLGTDTQYTKSCNNLEILLSLWLEGRTFPREELAVYIFYKVELQGTPLQFLPASEVQV